MDNIILAEYAPHKTVLLTLELTVARKVLLRQTYSEITGSCELSYDEEEVEMLHKFFDELIMALDNDKVHSVKNHRYAVINGKITEFTISALTKPGKYTLLMVVGTGKLMFDDNYTSASRRKLVEFKDRLKCIMDAGV